MAFKVKSISNVRDLGGIPSADGKKVKSGRLIRGGHLSKLTDEDKDKLVREVNLKLVIDLRSPSELEEKKDVIPNQTEYVHYPSLTNEQNPSINRNNRKTELSRIMKLEGGAVGHLSRTYRTLITQDMSRDSHRNILLKLLANEDGAAYWHCTQGKDRTGVAAAVILMALGVSREEIMKDYLNEKKSLKIKNGFLTTLVGILMFNPKAKSNLSALMNAKRPCMEAAFDEIDKVYGSDMNYIREGLGITEEQIEKLRIMYLI